ncbi:Hypothetical protein RG1141_PA08330 (plasmid) [Neorhizobium galegae bv. officinalis bv. officinalis str. HAMBI 1141]|uniref:Thoeris protein ThsB TIR-like domain-containing protein n=1 Tax=Neorhizobium galegae bv. officinalis bv. officinalis str. HAMBI 1141 TaxID=1028801 RepID=A0A068TJG6_NEOGA|nr:TIR domain-containing protein [Neorhizobium galegae]CDN57665.1 Hypothetical protein RG1141_PA08330 [Neorhizobium galegae bv. officinalis bv. officinalis str. HAMBI 1141]
MTGIFGLYPPVVQQKKRRTFFSFHYADIMRVNVVRMSGEFATSSTAFGRNIEGYYDGSLWESRKLQGDDALKSLIRTGVENTSTVCVLVGSETWQRRWVKYEIARSVIDGKGLLAIHINSINHHQRHRPDERGLNPCRMIGLGRADNGSIFLCERVWRNGRWIWEWYQDYTQAVPFPGYFKDPLPVGTAAALSDFTREYDWMQNGHHNIGGWIDMAAADAGR